LPEVECVFLKFRGAKCFSKMDMRAGFWQVMLDNASSKLCTFSTPFGRLLDVCEIFNVGRPTSDEYLPTWREYRPIMQEVKNSLDLKWKTIGHPIR
jgi:hypothetical protein